MSDSLLSTGLQDPQPAALRASGALALVLLLCAVPMLMRLGVRDSTHTMENIALVTSQETWQRQHAGEPRAWLMPTSNGRPRIEKPPLLVWLNLAAWSDLDPATTDPATLVFRARLVSVALALLMVAAVFWMGLTLGDLRLAVMAGLIAGTMILLQRQARTASYDIAMAAWATAAVASGWWTIQPFRDAPSRARWIGGWLLTGALAGCAWMSKSPLALLLVIGGLAPAVVLDPRRWRSSAAGLALALALGAALVVPWYVYSFEFDPAAVKRLQIEFVAARDKPAQLYYYLNVFGLVAPWTAWLIGGLGHPFVRAAGPERRRRLIAWVWFLLTFIAFSLHPEAKQQRYILPIVPAASLLAAMVWWDHARMAHAGRADRGAAMLWIPHWCGLLVASLASSLLFLAPQWLVDRGLAQKPPVTAQPWPLAIGVGLTLAVLAIIGWRCHARWRPWPAYMAAALWALLATAVFWQAYSTTPTRMALVRADAARVKTIISDAPLRYLVLDANVDFAPEEEFRFYIGRIIHAVTPDGLRDLAVSGPAFVMAAADEPHRAALTAAGFKPLGEIREGTHATRHLWRSTSDQ